jgi:3-oxosteroid 1-dehydrogenase
MVEKRHVSQGSQRPVRRWAPDVDWICVGSGIGGCAAAIVGHDQGLRTVLLEKTPTIGGTTAQSGGILWVPLNHLLDDAGLKDSRAEALDYLRYTGGGRNLPEYMETYVDEAARVLRYLHAQADVSFRLMDLAEFYYPIAPGSKERGRLVICEPFPAETLGAWRDKVRLSVFYHGLSTVLHGPNPALGGSDGPQVGHSGPLRHTDRGLAPWCKRSDWPELEPLLQADEAQRVAGAGLAAYLFRAVLRRTIEVRTEASAEALLVEDGRVVGLTISHHGVEERLRARKGVVLATGTGPGWRLATAVGAEVSTVPPIQGMLQIHVPGENYPDGSPVLRGNYELRMRHGLVVNRRGKRFGNEYFFQALGSQMGAFETCGGHRFTNVPCYLIFDQNLLETYSFVGRPPGITEGLEWVERGDTLAELARKLGIRSAELEATVARFNVHARRGEDPDFGRQRDSLGPVEKPPFYGVELVTPDPFRANITIVVNRHAQVLHDATQQPILGLYACGNMVATDRWLGVGYQAGCQLMGAAIFGFLAAEHAAATCP